MRLERASFPPSKWLVLGDDSIARALEPVTQHDRLGEEPTGTASRRRLDEVRSPLDPEPISGRHVPVEHRGLLQRREL